MEEIRRAARTMIWIGVLTALFCALTTGTAFSVMMQAQGNDPGDATGTSIMPKILPCTGG